MTLREEERSIIIQYRIKQAGQALDDAEFLLINKRLSLAANRIYYSLFYSISAVALKNNFSTAKHKQLIGWFNRHFINTGIVDKKYSKLVYSAFENREKGDYDFLFTLSHEELENSLKQTKFFVSTTITKLLA